MPNDRSAQTRQFARTVLKPLTAREASAATRAAIREVLQSTDTGAERIRPYPVELRIEKPAARNGAPTRLLRVRVHDRDRHRFHDITVDTNGGIVDHHQSDRTSAAVLPEELEEAQAVAQTDGRVARLLANAAVRIEIVSSAGHDPGRRIGLRLVRVGAVLEELGVVDVDLDTAQICRLELSTLKGVRR